MTTQNVVYVGPFTGVQVPVLGVEATKNVAITVDTAVAAVLLASDDWEASDSAANPAVTVATQGQTLVITAVTVGGVSKTLYTDAEATASAVSLPATISANTTYYLAHDTEGALSMSTTWPDGTVLTAVTGTTRNGKTLTVSPYPTDTQVVLSANTAAHGSGAAKGDLFAATGTGALSRVTVGTNGQVLTADSTATAGVKWADVDGGTP